MHGNPQDVLHELEEMAKRLAARKCFYLAAVLLRDYDGDCAPETREARLKMALAYSDLARQHHAAREAGMVTPAPSTKPR